MKTVSQTTQIVSTSKLAHLLASNIATQITDPLSLNNDRDELIAENSEDFGGSENDSEEQITGEEDGNYIKALAYPNTATPFFEPTRRAPIEDEDAVSSEQHQRFFTHLTISRDQTESSDFRKQQLVAVSVLDPKIENRYLQETKLENDLLLDFGDEPGALENFDFDSFLQVGNDNMALTGDFDFGDMSDLPAPPASPPAPGPPKSLFRPVDPLRIENETRPSVPTLEPVLKRKYPYDTSESSPEDVGPGIERFKDRRVDDGNDVNLDTEIDSEVWKRDSLKGNSIDKLHMTKSEASIAHKPGASLSIQTNPTAAHTPGFVQPVPQIPLVAMSDNQSALIDRLQKRVSELENEIKEKPKSTQKRPRIQVFHMVENNERPITCLQEPTWTFNSNDMISLKAELPLIVSTDQHLQCNQDIVIAVYKKYRAPYGSPTYIAKQVKSDTMPPPRPYDESIQLVSVDMRLAVEQYLQARGALEREFPTKLSLANSIPAPYLFWYRSRHTPQDLSVLSPIHLRSMQFLTGWIESNYKSQYNEFEEKLSRGRVSRKFMKFIFAPGDVIVFKDSGQQKAYLTTEVPPIQEYEPHHYRRLHVEDPFESNESEPSDGKNGVKHSWRWSVPCWSIGYDGEFYKVPTTLELELDAETHDAEVSLADLNILPLRLAGEAVEQQLRRRGHTFWSCRVKRFVAYRADEEDTLNNVR